MTTQKLFTTQGLFDNALNGLRAQGCTSRSGIYGLCSYRSLDGLKCAIGFSIPDEVYSKDMEEHSASVIARKFNLFPGIRADFLDDLQLQLHDRYSTRWNSESFNDWLEERAEIFAEENNLVYSK